MSRGPLRATDKRRTKQHKVGVRETESDTDGAGRPLADLFNDRRHANGHGKRTT